MEQHLSPESSASLPAQTSSSSTSKVHGLPRVRSSSGYVYPAIWSFPPFFTQQPNPQTLLHQTGLWANLLLSYARFHRIFTLSLDAIDRDPLEVFHNQQISRKLGPGFLSHIFAYLVQAGQATPYPPLKSTKSKPSSVLLYWHKPEEWATLVYDWVSNTGQTNSILTFYDLQTSSPPTEFHDLPAPLLREALEVLVKQGKAQLFRGTSSEDGESGEGVKFV